MVRLQSIIALFLCLAIPLLAYIFPYLYFHELSEGERLEFREYLELFQPFQIVRSWVPIGMDQGYIYWRGGGGDPCSWDETHTAMISSTTLARGTIGGTST